MKTTNEAMQAARQSGRATIQQNLGDLRTFASQFAHENTDIDEEKFFYLMALEYFRGLKGELFKVFDTDKIDILLNPYRTESCPTLEKTSETT
jgi:hypothetical protein